MTRLLPAIYITALFSAVLLLTLHSNMLKGFNHDEHMYVAGGALLAREGLIPYRDFPYFQMPNLPLLYAATFLFNSNLLFSARLFSTLCALVIAATLFWIGWRASSSYPTPIRLLIGTCSTLLLLANPVYFYASGLAWNHDPSIMFGLLAFVLYIEGVKRDSLKFMGAAGALLGLAIGTRLTFAFALIPLSLMPFTIPIGFSFRRKLLLAASLLAGCVAALLPSLILFALAPGRFLFGNIGYHILNEQYYQTTLYTRTADLIGKLDYLRDVALAPGSQPLLLLTFLFTLPLCLVALWRRAYPFEALCALAVALALMLGSLASSPTWLQYFYAPVPFLIAAALYALQSVKVVEPVDRVAGVAYVAMTVLSVAVNAPQYAGRGSLLVPHEWVPVAMHQEASRLNDHLQSGPVLTLAPLFPLEAGLDIYPAFASGPFAWRSGGLLSPQERQALGIVPAEDLGDYLSAPPPAILTGYEDIWESALLDYARERGYREVRLADGGVLWLER
jgi:hypothetical protein